MTPFIKILLWLDSTKKEPFELGEKMALIEHFVLKEHCPLKEHFAPIHIFDQSEA